MVKEIIFDVGRKIHCVPWKYGRCFFLPIQGEYKVLFGIEDYNNSCNFFFLLASYLVIGDD
jgi:hypothetical protein